MLSTLSLLALAVGSGGQSFEDLFQDSEPVEDISQLVGAGARRCDEASDTARRQCEQIRAFMRGRTATGKFHADGDSAAVRIEPYDARAKGVVIGVVGCLACQPPLDIDGHKIYVTVRPIPRGGPAPPAGRALDVARRTVPMAGDLGARWAAEFGRQLRAQFVFRMGPGEWTQGESRGLGFEPLGWRVYNRCTGEVIASEPPSQAPAAPDPDASCAKAGGRGAGAGTGAPAAGAPGAGGGVGGRPERLGPSEIRAALDPVNAAARECFEKFKTKGGLATTIIINGDGTIQSMQVKGSLMGTPAGECISTAIRAVKFPPFRAEQQVIEYPVFLR